MQPQTEAVKKAVEKKGNFKKLVSEKFHNIVVLYFVLSILTVVAIAGSIRYEIFKDHSIVVSNANASVISKEILEENKEASIVDCESAIEVYSEKYDAPKGLLNRIMQSESGNKNTAANKESTARGCFQFIFGTWELYGKRHWGEEFYGKSVYSPKDNVELAAWAITTYGTSDWDASKHNWAK